MPHANRPAPMAQPQAWLDLIKQQQIILQQLQRQQQDWLRGWMGWMQQWTSPQQTQAMSRLIEQEFDLLTHFMRLMGEQARSIAPWPEQIGEQETAAMRRVMPPPQLGMLAWPIPAHGHGHKIRISGPDDEAEEAEETAHERPEGATRKAKPASRPHPEKEEPAPPARSAKEVSSTSESKH